MSCSQQVRGTRPTAQTPDTIPVQKCGLRIGFRLKYSTEKEDPVGQISHLLLAAMVLKHETTIYQRAI